MKNLSFIALAIAIVISTASCKHVSKPWPRSLDAVSGATRFGNFKVQHLKKVDAVNKVADFLEKSGPYFFASADKDQPRVRPIGIFLKYNNRIYFHIGKQKDSYRQILVNPNVELVSISKEKDGGWIRITGRAVPDNGEELDKAVFEKAPGLKNMYNEETGFSLGHFYIMNGTAEISGADGTSGPSFFSLQAVLFLRRPAFQGFIAFGRHVAAAALRDRLAILVQNDQRRNAMHVEFIRHGLPLCGIERNRQPAHLRLLHVAFHGCLVFVETHEDDFKILLRDSVAERDQLRRELAARGAPMGGEIDADRLAFERRGRDFLALRVHKLLAETLLQPILRLGLFLRKRRHGENGGQQQHHQSFVKIHLWLLFDCLPITSTQYP